jgi:tRNA (guanine10-N2)-dimethyltransferase
MNLFSLSGENITLAKREIESLSSKKTQLIGNLLLTEASPLYINRLGCSHTVYQLLFVATTKNLAKEIEKFAWQKVYHGSFCVRVHDGKSFSEKMLASLIWHRVRNPNVDLTNPKTKIEFFVRGSKVFCAIFIKEADKSFLDRRAHLRPKLHPTSMSPKLARAMINLSGIRKGTLLDPFCGTGGILIEAGFLGYKITGYDFWQDMLDSCRKNLNHYRLKCRLEKRDSRSISGRYDLIVTDLPYGKNSKVDSIHDVYSGFFKSSYGCTDNMVVGMPDSVRNTIVRPWRVKDKFLIYVHKSMTRKILVLKKR